MLTSINCVLGYSYVFWITVLFMPGPLVLSSFASRSALIYSSRWICLISNDWKPLISSYTIFMYFDSPKSLVWYFPCTWLVTNRESLFSCILVSPSCWANLIPANKVSYSVWLLLAWKFKHNDYSSSNSSGPSKTKSAPLPLRLDDLYTNKTKRKGDLC